VRIVQTLVKRHYELRAGGIKADRAVDVVPSLRGHRCTPLEFLIVTRDVRVRPIFAGYLNHSADRTSNTILAGSAERRRGSDSWIGSAGDAISFPPPPPPPPPPFLRSPVPSPRPFFFLFPFYYFSSPFLRECPLWRCLVRRAWRR